MATHCQTVTRGGGSERQNLGVVNFFGDKKGGSQLQTKNMIGTVDYKLLYSLYFLLNTWYSLYRKLCRRLWITFVDTFVLIMLDLGWGGGGGGGGL